MGNLRHFDGSLPHRYYASSFAHRGFTHVSLPLMHTPLVRLMRHWVSAQMPSFKTLLKCNRWSKFNEILHGKYLQFQLYNVPKWEQTIKNDRKCISKQSPITFSQECILECLHWWLHFCHSVSKATQLQIDHINLQEHIAWTTGMIHMTAVPHSSYHLLCMLEWSLSGHFCVCINYTEQISKGWLENTPKRRHFQLH